MSAFMVADSTINTIVAAFANNPTIVSQFMRYGYDLRFKEDRRSLAVRMFVLNKMGVESRYGKGEAKTFRPLNFVFEDVAPTRTVAAYKALGCLLYQCSEGNVPDTKLFKRLEQAQDVLAHQIIYSLPDYQNAKWG